MLKTVAFALMLAASPALAQTPAAVRGTIASVAADGETLTMTSLAGETVAVKLGPKTRFAEVTRASAADLKTNAFIGVAAVPDKDGGMKALEVHVFPDSMRGAGEGFHPFDLAPKSTMTNGALNAKVGGVDGDKLTIDYRSGSKTIRLPPDTPIVALAPGDKADAKPGAAAVVRGVKGADGSVEAAYVAVGKDGVVPPM